MRAYNLPDAFFGVGEFEIHININKRHTETLIKNNIVMLGADGHKVGIIRYREIDNKELIIRGQTLGGILGKRSNTSRPYLRI